MPKRVVISIHGIRTRGVWQKDLVPILARANFIPYVLDYGNFTAVALLRNSRRERQIEWLLTEYNRIVLETGDERPSIIAHSFGTLQVAALVERYPTVKFDKIIFAASIVRPNFDWATVLDEGRVNFVENDYGGRDFWPRVAARIVRGAGNSGSVGFQCQNDFLNQRSFSKYKHSNYFHYSHFKQNWIPTLLLNKRQLVEVLKAGVRHTANALKISYTDVRAHVFVPDKSSDDRLRIVPGLHVNMDDEAELKITLPTNLGVSVVPGAAQAFVAKKVAVIKNAPYLWSDGVLRPHPNYNGRFQYLL